MLLDVLHLPKQSLLWAVPAHVQHAGDLSSPGLFPEHMLCVDTSYS